MILLWEIQVELEKAILVSFSRAALLSYDDQSPSYLGAQCLLAVNLRIVDPKVGRVLFGEVKALQSAGPITTSALFAYLAIFICHRRSLLALIRLNALHYQGKTEYEGGWIDPDTHN